MTGTAAVSLAAVLLALNVVAFALMGADKRRAMAGRRRIPERTLLAWAAVSGTAGTWLGMRAFRHKTRKRSFVLRLAAVTAGDALLVLALVALLG